MAKQSSPPQRKPPLPRRPKPTYDTPPLKKAIRGAMENIERSVTQPAKNIANTVTEGIRKIRKSVGK